MKYKKEKSKEKAVKSENNKILHKGSLFVILIVAALLIEASLSLAQESDINIVGEESYFESADDLSRSLSMYNFDFSIFDGFDYARYVYGAIPENAEDNGFEEMPDHARKIYEKKSSEKIKYNKDSLFKVKDSKGVEAVAEMIIYDYEPGKEFKNKISKKEVADGEIVDLEIALPGRFNSFEFQGLQFDKNKSLKIEDLPEDSAAKKNINIHGKRILKAYAMNLDELNFTSGRYHDFAEGHELWKCKDWNFEQQQCYGSWVKIMDLIQGTEYSFEVSPVDPAYVEVFDASNAIDVDVAFLDNETIVLAWVDGDAGNHVSFEVWSTRGVRLVDETDIDTTGDTGDAVAVTAINTTHFVVGWIDGPADDLRHAGYTRTGANYIASAQIDANIGTLSDVDVCELGSGTLYALINANQNDGDADFRIRNNDGTSSVGELNVDGGIAPEANNQNLVSCSPVNSTVWAYAFFDDTNTQLDATLTIVTNAGAAVVTADVDAAVGETAQVAVAGLRNNRMAYVFYDSTAADQDVTMTVRSITGAVLGTVLGNTDIDTNAGTSSRVSVSEVEFSGASYFVVAWFDQSDTTIKAGVYDDSGTQVTAPFTVTSTPTATYPIVSVAGYSSLLGFGACNGTFAIAYTNSSGAAVFETYWYDGTRWDGRCPEYIAPIVTVISPQNNTLNKSTSMINFYYNVTDYSIVSNCTLYINNLPNVTNTSITKDTTLNFTVNLSNSNYTWKISCVDEFGNAANTSSYNLNVSWYVPVIQQLTTEAAVNLNPGSSRKVDCNATIYEGNGATDISKVNATLFRSNTSIAGPESNNTHYTNASCTSTSSAGNYSNYTCSFYLQYYAFNGTWNCTVNAYDSDGWSGTNTTQTLVEALYAFNLSDLLIDYGDVSPGSNSSDKFINITNYGNMQMNISVKGYGGDDPVTGDGYAMRCASGDNITIDNQKYSRLSGVLFNQKTSLTSSSVHMNFTLQIQTQPTLPSSNSSYWQLFVPPMNSVTQCNGTIVFTAAAP